MRNKLLIPIIFIFSLNYIHCIEPSSIQGVWVRYQTYEWLINSQEKQDGVIKVNFSWGEGNCLRDSLFIDTLRNEFNYGRNWRLEEVNKTDLNNQLEVIISVNGNRAQWERRIICTFLDTDTMYFTGDIEGTGIPHGQDSLLYRISGPAKIPVKEGTINDTRVRLRTKPNLSSETWGFLSIGDKVKVKDKSAEKYEIDGESWYWYKVDLPNYPEGWVYGKYVDIVE